VRHYNESSSAEMLDGKKVVLLQKTTTTLQALYH
jgi:hypothetical protein